MIVFFLLVADCFKWLVISKFTTENGYFLNFNGLNFEYINLVLYLCFISLNIRYIVLLLL